MFCTNTNRIRKTKEDKNNMKESEIILYTTPKGDVKIDIRFEDETFWLTQKKLAALFDVEVNTINYHLKEIFKSGELSEDSTIRKIRIVQTEGTREVSRQVEFYNPIGMERIAQSAVSDIHPYHKWSKTTANKHLTTAVEN